MAAKKDEKLKSLQSKLRTETMNQFVTIRKELGKTQNDISEATGILRPNISRMESGNYNPTLDMIARMAYSVGKKIVITYEDI